MVVFSTVNVGAQTPAPTKGINVEMAVSTSAASLPDADNPDAWILTVTRGGTLFFGTLPGTPEELFGEMKARPRKRAQEIYIKADARASFDSVRRALDLARKALFRRAFLLTSQPTEMQPGTIVPPKSLPVWFAVDFGAEPVELQIAAHAGESALRLGNDPIAINELQHRLESLLQNRSDREVLLKAGNVPFADVAHIIDICNAAGAKVVIEKSEI
jgi:biopolymer transport protein ExbD